VTFTVIPILFRFSSEYELAREEFRFTHNNYSEHITKTATILLFTFSGHSILPKVFSEANNQEEWWISTNITYIFFILIFLAVAATNYGIYGNYIGRVGQILGVLSNNDFGSSYLFWVHLVQIIIPIQIIFIILLLSNPVVTKIENIFSKTTRQEGFISQVKKTGIGTRLIVRLLFFLY